MIVPLHLAEQTKIISCLDRTCWIAVIQQVICGELFVLRDHNLNCGCLCLRIFPELQYRTFKRRAGFFNTQQGVLQLTQSHEKFLFWPLLLICTCRLCFAPSTLNTFCTLSKSRNMSGSAEGCGGNSNVTPRVLCGCLSFIGCPATACWSYLTSAHVHVKQKANMPYVSLACLHPCARSYRYGLAPMVYTIFVV